MKLGFWKREPAHKGSASCYSRGCRLPQCRKPFVAQVMAARKARRAEFKRTGELPVYAFHGTMNAYGNFGCRCVKCKACASAHFKARYQARKAVAQ